MILWFSKPVFYDILCFIILARTKSWNIRVPDVLVYTEVRTEYSERSVNCMVAVTQQSMWNVMERLPEEKRRQVFNFAISLDQEDEGPTGDAFLAKIDRGIAQKNAGTLQYHELIED